MPQWAGSCTTAAQASWAFSQCKAFSRVAGGWLSAEVMPQGRQGLDYKATQLEPLWRAPTIYLQEPRC